jgi:hypothetical protein
MVGNVALLGGFHDSAGIPGHPKGWPPGLRFWWFCPSPWLPDAVSPGHARGTSRFYYAPIEDEIG